MKNLIINGSFELNNITDINCKVDISNTSYNNLIDYSTSFSQYGGNENLTFPIAAPLF
jgi:hypothetical protein